MPCCGWQSVAFTSTGRRTSGTYTVKSCPGIREPPQPIKPSSDSPRWHVRSGKDCHAEYDFQGAVVAPGDDVGGWRFGSEVVEEAGPDRTAGCERRIGPGYARFPGSGFSQSGGRSKTGSYGDWRRHPVGPLQSIPGEPLVLAEGLVLQPGNLKPALDLSRKPHPFLPHRRGGTLAHRSGRGGRIQLAGCDRDRKRARRSSERTDWLSAKGGDPHRASEFHDSGRNRGGGDDYRFCRRIADALVSTNRLCLFSKERLGQGRGHLPDISPRPGGDSSSDSSAIRTFDPSGGIAPGDPDLRQDGDRRNLARDAG